MLCLILGEYKGQVQSNEERQVYVYTALIWGLGTSGKTEQKHIKEELLTK